jgi:hypothetical protein
MTEIEYAAFRTSVEDTFVSLYALDAGSLTPDQRKLHQQVLSTTYLAMIGIENKAFSELTKQTVKKVEQLSGAMLAMQHQLVGLKQAAEVLQIVSGALDVLSAITKLFK